MRKLPLFQFAAILERATLNWARRNRSAAPKPPRAIATLRPQTARSAAGLGEFKTFQEIYRELPVKLNGAYGIIKVGEMLKSPYLAEMSAEAKRSSLLMALEAAGANVEDVLQDAMMRQRALNEYEDEREREIQEFEEGIASENTSIQAEIDRLTAELRARIQANLDAVAREQDSFRAWQRRKQQESQRIAEAAAFCVPSGTQTNSSSVTAVLDRVRVFGRAGD